MFELRLVKGKNPALCPVARCRNPRAPARYRTRGVCSKCKMRYWRSHNPISDAYSNLRRSAKVRKIPFELTMPEWVAFCAMNDYIEKRGSHRGGLQIDRIDSKQGYKIGNIQVLECAAHGRKSSNARWNNATSCTKEPDPF